MEPLEETSLQANDTGKTTCTFRIMPHEKLLLAAKAQALGMSPSQYIEALVLGQHNEIQQRMEATQKQRNAQFTEDEEKLFYAFLAKLRQRYPNNSSGEIILASLAHAFENFDALWQRSMKTFLRRVRSNHYKS
jgi:CRP-like cAMP-binding protein